MRSCTTVAPERRRTRRAGERLRGQHAAIGPVVGAGEAHGRVFIGPAERAGAFDRVPIFPPLEGMVRRKEAVGLLIHEPAALDFAIGTVVIAEDAGPSAAFFGGAPGEHLLPEGVADIGDVRDAEIPLFVIDAEEVLPPVEREDIASVLVGIVGGHVFAVMDGPVVVPAPGTHPGAGVDHAHSEAGRDGGVGPEVIGMGEGGAIGQPDVGFDQARSRAEPNPHGPGHAEALLEVAHPGGGAAIGLSDQPVVHGRGGGNGVAFGEVELDAAAEPRAAQSDEAGLDDVVAIEDLPAGELILGGVEVPAELGQDDDLHVFVFQHQGPILDRAGHLADVVHHGIGVDVPIAFAMEGGIGVFGPEDIGGDFEDFLTALDSHCALSS